jgi:hypothetical protein
LVIKGNLVTVGMEERAGVSRVVCVLLRVDRLPSNNIAQQTQCDTFETKLIVSGFSATHY